MAGDLVTRFRAQAGPAAVTRGTIEMNTRSIIVLTIFLFVACETSQSPNDQSYFLRGQVIDSASGGPITNALVGYRHPTVPDSLVFPNDTVDITVPDGFLVAKTTDQTGSFEFVFFLGARDTSVYDLLFVYKSGFTLWRYDRSPVPITATAQYVDEIVIRLVTE
jgi:hypothetical protein